MKLTLLIEDKEPKSHVQLYLSPSDYEDVTVAKVEAEGDAFQIMRQLRAVADSLIPPQRWVTGMPLPDEAQKPSKPGSLQFPDA